MKKQYTVFSAHIKTADVDAKLPDGTEVKATIPHYEVQLVPVEPTLDGTIKLSITGTKAILDAMGMFIEGAVVDAEFSITKAEEA